MLEKLQELFDLGANIRFVKSQTFIQIMLRITIDGEKCWWRFDALKIEEFLNERTLVNLLEAIKEKRVVSVRPEEHMKEKTMITLL